ncbi:MAG: hypothetical protein NUV61_04315 [Candidatus Azambacteria bacterium]|nr:hypothetical protein [Candidatus Azambacteria bacterium]
MMEYAIALLKVFGSMREDAVILLFAFGTAVCAIIIWKDIVGPWLDRRAVEKRKELTFILIDPTRPWSGSTYTIREKKGKTRYYRNGWRISEKAHDKGVAEIFQRISDRNESFENPDG